MRRVWLLILLALCSMRCGGNGSTPTQPSAQTVSVTVGLTGAPFTATVEGRIISADGLYTVPMTPGTHEISGTFSSGLMVVAFAGAGTLANGGVRSGSLVSVEGLAPNVLPCGIGWGDFTRRQFSFRVRFTVTTDTLSACH
jgi:hypothetical protein